MSQRCRFLIACLLAQTFVLAQTAAPPPPPPRFVNPWATATQPNVPSDPLEIVASAEPVQDVAHRAAAIKLLENAQFLSNLRRGPYDLKTTFTTSQGAWQVEDSSPAREIYRWAVQGPSYSAVNLFVDRVLYSNQTATGVPLRVAQVHSAIFAHFPAYGPRATMRLASAALNGSPVTCVLVSHMANAQPVSGPRRWNEYESCINPESGLLMSYSPAPGMYVLYDYSSPQRLGSIIFPGKFIITEAGQTVVEAQVTSLTAPSNADPSAYTPSGLNALGVGFPLTPPWKMEDIDFGGRRNPNATNAHFVVVRGMMSPDGTVTDAEVLASSNTTLNQRALERASEGRRFMAQNDQNGATPQSHEVFLVTLFLTTN